MLKILTNLLLLSILGLNSVAKASEIRVVATVAVKGSINDISSQFERSTGNHIAALFAPGPTVKKKIDEGEPFDVAILTPNLIEELTKSGKMDATTVTTIARTGVGVAIRIGTPRPDLSSVETFKSSLLAAKLIGMTDPASGAAGAVYVAKMFEKLGIADQLRPKLRLYPAGSGGFPNAILTGDVDLWLTQISEIVPVVGLELAGPLPPELQFYTAFAAGSSSTASTTADVRRLLSFFGSPAAKAVFKSVGMELGN